MHASMEPSRRTSAAGQNWSARDQAGVIRHPRCRRMCRGGRFARGRKGRIRSPARRLARGSAERTGERRLARRTAGWQRGRLLRLLLGKKVSELWRRCAL